MKLKMLKKENKKSDIQREIGESKLNNICLLLKFLKEFTVDVLLEIFQKQTNYIQLEKIQKSFYYFFLHISHK